MSIILLPFVKLTLQTYNIKHFITALDNELPLFEFAAQYV